MNFTAKSHILQPTIYVLDRPAKIHIQVTIFRCQAALAERVYKYIIMVNHYFSGVTDENVVVEVSSGNITIDELTGNDLSVRNGSGNININSFQGKVNTVNQSGNIVVSNFVGEGTFDVGSGNIDLTVNDIIGDISLSSNSGTIDLIMGQNISFIFDAEVRSGTINAPDLSRQVNTKVQHNIGFAPTYKVFAKNGSGNINIK